MIALVISDANVIIDLECAGLTGRIFRLPMEIAVPDLLFHDELSEQHGNLPALGLQILELSPALIDQASILCTRHSAAGIYDMFALALAQDRRCPLLTGDKMLRLLAGGDTSPDTHFARSCLQHISAPSPSLIRVVDSTCHHLLAHSYTPITRFGVAK